MNWGTMRAAVMLMLEGRRKADTHVYKVENGTVFSIQELV
jgi:hypothetical protein